MAPQDVLDPWPRVPHLRRRALVLAPVGGSLAHLRWRERPRQSSGRRGRRGGGGGGGRGGRGGGGGGGSGGARASRKACDRHVEDALHLILDRLLVLVPHELLVLMAGVLMPAVLVLARRLELVPHVALEALEPADELLLDIAGGVQRLTHKHHRLLHVLLPLLALPLPLLPRHPRGGADWRVSNLEIQEKT